MMNVPSSVVLKYKIFFQILIDTKKLLNIIFINQSI
jgi:hypothetical protein